MKFNLQGLLCGTDKRPDQYQPKHQLSLTKGACRGLKFNCKGR